MKLLRLLLIPCLVLAGVQSVWAQTPSCDNTLTVQPGDTLARIAIRTYGEAAAYRDIVSATNAQAASNSSFTNISNPNRIEPGWKLCLPARGDAVPVTPDETPVTPDATPPAEGTTRFTLLQINDVYEMTPLGGEGGVARLATLKKQLETANPNTYSILSGDLFSPSALGTAKVDGDRLAGKQMVAAMNAFGLDFATFGNHEFDIKEEQFLARMDETTTQWFSSNVFQDTGELFDGVPQNLIFTVPGGDNPDVTVGMFGVTLDSNPVDYVSYTDPFEAAASQIAALKDVTDVLIAVTHLTMEQDTQLAERFPEIDMVIGGHEHENAMKRVGPGQTPITKADANARTAYILDIAYDHGSGTAAVNPRLADIDGRLADDPATAAVVNKWVELAFAGFREQGFDPSAHVVDVPIELDGMESSVRNQSTDLTDLISAAMLREVPDADAAFFNGGAIRIDDHLPPGGITEYDVIRILPFGGAIASVDMPGEVLTRALDQGIANAGSGGYLHSAGAVPTQSSWAIDGELIDPAQTYKVAIAEFLLTGLEQGLDFLKSDNPDITNVETHADIRTALIAELKAQYGGEGSP